MVLPDLVLFDIDGTLLRTRGAGREALDEAFLRLLGWERATEGVPVAGSTDGAIVRGVAARFGRAWPASGPAPLDERALRSLYLDGLRRRAAEPGRVEACPGAHEALAALRTRAHVGLLTGNWEVGAAVKLGAVGLDGGFAFGAYGDDATDRNALVPVACARAEALGLRWRRVVVIGDTPADIACARAGGAVAVAVETGFASADQLAAAAPDLQIPDLQRGLGWLCALLGSEGAALSAPAGTG
jgi:phosphoglycolate phosphatase